MLVYDTIPFFNELDLLEIRLEELWSVVDRFYIQEATKTFSNREKPLYLAENWDRFKKYRSKIDHHVVDDYQDAPVTDALAFDNWQKGQLVQRLAAAPSQAIVLLADLDEIPRAAAVRKAKNNLALCSASLEMVGCCHWLNCIYVGKIYRDAKVLRRGIITEGQYDVVNLRRNQEPPWYTNAGWHFTSLWPQFPEKLTAWGHPELNRPPFNTSEYQEKCRNEGLDPFGRGYSYEFCYDDAFLPQYVRENRARFAHLIRDREEKATDGTSS